MNKINLQLTEKELLDIIDAMSFQLDNLADQMLRPRQEYAKALYNQKLPLLWRLNAYVPKSEHGEDANEE